MNRYPERLLVATYSIVARDPATGQFGVAVQTHQTGVGRIVPWLLPGVGAIATQSLVNISYGPMGLVMLQEGVPAERVLSALIASDPLGYRRQIGIVDANGRAAAYTGSGCIREAQHYVGDGYAIQANMMLYPTVIESMRFAYEHANGSFAERLLAALFIAQSEGGDIRGMQSAALKIVSGNRHDPHWQTIYDLRVDEHENPLLELERLATLRRAAIINDEGERLLAAGDYQSALRKFKEARDLAPNDEELAFWQAVALADSPYHHSSLSIAGRILKQSLKEHSVIDRWIELIYRLRECGLIQRAAAADELVTAWKEA